MHEPGGREPASSAFTGVRWPELPSIKCRFESCANSCIPKRPQRRGSARTFRYAGLPGRGAETHDHGAPESGAFAVKQGGLPMHRAWRRFGSGLWARPGSWRCREQFPTELRTAGIRRRRLSANADSRPIVRRTICAIQSRWQMLSPPVSVHYWIRQYSLTEPPQSLGDQQSTGHVSKLRSG